MGPSSLPSSDSELVRLALEGQSQAFGELYDRYLSSVYDFVFRMTRNAEEAADLAQETFLKAMENLGGLQNPARFKSWLFSIAHHGALNRLERRRREVVPSPASDSGEDAEASDPLLQQVDTDRLANPEQATEARESARLVWEAAASLDPRTYAVLDLHVRQGLESAEIAEVLGVSKGNAYTMLNRMKKSVQEAIGTFLLARRGSRDCDGLQAILAPVAIPPVTPELRRAIDRHVRRCDVCSRRRRALLTPIEVFGALAAVPVPIGLRDAIWGQLGAGWAASQSEGAGPASSDAAEAEGPGPGSGRDAADAASHASGQPEQYGGTEASSPTSGGGSGGWPPTGVGASDGWDLWRGDSGWTRWFRPLRLGLSRRMLIAAAVGATVVALVPAAVALSFLWSGSNGTPPVSPFSGSLDGGTATAVSASLKTPVPTTESAMPIAGTAEVPAMASPGSPSEEQEDQDGDGLLGTADDCPERPETFNGYEDEDGCPDEVPEGGPIPEEVPDYDGDGLAGDADHCPEQPETLNGYEDEDGCPDEVPAGGEIPEEIPDQDGDGLPDSADHCPEQPETFNGYEDEDGCPDEVPGGGEIPEEIPDQDGDGLAGDADHCPEQPETFNGYEDEDGCPDALPDTDGDGLPDTSDGCPTQPEDRDGYQDEDGCPDTDNDGDGFPDASDWCPNRPETFNGFGDEDGCPDEVPDTDGDGLPDTSDSCPIKPEDWDGYQDSDGCPDTDNDGDGIPDTSDHCPNQPETYNDHQDEDGCPDLA